MAEQPRPPEADAGEEPGDSLRAAVTRTLAATTGSASGAGARARELLDEVAKRGGAAREELLRRRDELGRRGDQARQGLTRRGEEARDELARRGESATGRLAEAIGELRGADRSELGPISEGIRAIERRLEELEQALRPAGRAADVESSSEASEESYTEPQVEVEIDPDEADSSA